MSSHPSTSETGSSVVLWGCVCEWNFVPAQLTELQNKRGGFVMLPSAAEATRDCFVFFQGASLLLQCYFFLLPASCLMGCILVLSLSLVLFLPVA